MSRNGPIAREAILVDGNDQRFFEKALSDPRSLWIRFSNRRIYRIFSPSRACDGRPFRPARISGGERHRKYLTSSTHSSQTCQELLTDPFGPIPEKSHLAGSGTRPITIPQLASCCWASVDFRIRVTWRPAHW